MNSRTESHTRNHPLYLARTSPFLLYHLFPTKLNSQPFALTTPFSFLSLSVPPSLPISYFVSPVCKLSRCSHPSSKALLAPLKLSAFVFLLVFLFLSCSLSFSSSQFPSVSLRSTKRQVASRCRWVNTGGVWAIFGRGGRKEWSYSESGGTSAPPFPIRLSRAVQCLPSTALQTSPVRCGTAEATPQCKVSQARQAAI